MSFPDKGDGQAAFQRSVSRYGVATLLYLGSGERRTNPVNPERGHVRKEIP